MQNLRLLTCYLLILFTNCSLGQSKNDLKDNLLRFDIELRSGEYLFFEGKYFPKHEEYRLKPELYIPDEYFLKVATKIKISNQQTRWGKFFITSISEYLYIEINGKLGWIKANIPYPKDDIIYLRNILYKQNPKRSNETFEKLFIQYNYIEVTPFKDKNYILVNSDESDFVLNLKTKEVTWQSGGYFEGAYIDAETDYLKASGDLLGGQYTFDKNGNEVKPEKKEIKNIVDTLFQDMYSHDTSFTNNPIKERLAKKFLYYMSDQQNDSGFFKFVGDTLRQMGFSMEDLKPSEKPKILSNSDLLRIAIENQNYKQIDSLFNLDLNIDSSLKVFNKDIREQLPPLSYAVYLDDINTIQYLIDKGANMNKKNVSLKTPICYVQSKTSYDLLIENGASLEQLNYVDYSKRNIYPTEYFNRKIEVIDAMLENSRKRYYQDPDFYDKILYYLIEINDSNRIKKILQKGGELTIPKKEGVKFETVGPHQPIMYVKDKEMLKFFYRNGASITNISHYNDNIYLKAFQWNDAELVSWIETTGLKLNKPNNKYFVIAKDTVFMKKMIEKGISINSVDTYGNTALIRAKHFDNNPDLVNFLLRNGADKSIVNKRGGSFYLGRQRK